MAAPGVRSHAQQRDTENAIPARAALSSARHQLPSYAPDLNPLEGIWSSLKRGPLANVAFTGFAHLLQAAKAGLKKIQYQPASSKAASPEPGSASAQTERHRELKIF